MDVDDEQPQVRLKSCDGKRFTLSRSQACCSNALRNMVEGILHNSNTPTEYINLKSVNGHLLAKVVQWMEWHCYTHSDTTGDTSDKPGYYRTANATCAQESNYEMTDRDKAFLNSISELELFQLTHVANYLDVKTLFSACCQIIANKWEGLKVAELRKTYNIEGDFSAEEENQILQENRKLGMND